MTTALHVHQTLAVHGSFEFLRELERRASVTGLYEDEMLAAMRQAGIEAPAATLTEFESANILTRFGERIGLSTHGSVSLLLLEALNGADVREIYARLSRYHPSLRMYELVREGMTRQFLEAINDRPGFGRLYICSPWLNLDARQRGLLANGVHLAEKAGVPVELLVITRPDPNAEDGRPPGLTPFVDLGATVFLHPRLHTKLYIREPSRNGGHLMAIVGSQNLTRSTYLELGIRVNGDGTMITQLIRYFWDVANSSSND